MKNKYEINDILTAVDLILNEESSSNAKKKREVKSPLKLTNEVNIKKKKESLPVETENIILQAEKYLKKIDLFSKSFILTKLSESLLLFFLISS